jgi:hypothetical protein
MHRVGSPTLISRVGRGRSKGCDNGAAGVTKACQLFRDRSCRVLRAIPPSAAVHLDGRSRHVFITIRWRGTTPSRRGGRYGRGNAATSTPTGALWAARTPRGPCAWTVLSEPRSVSVIASPIRWRVICSLPFATGLLFARLHIVAASIPNPCRKAPRSLHKAAMLHAPEQSPSRRI